jgi:hypothetical protein
MFNELVRGMKRLQKIENKYYEEEKHKKEFCYSKDDGMEFFKEELKETSSCEFNSRMIKKLFKYLSKVNKLKIVIKRSISVKGNVFDTQDFNARKVGKFKEEYEDMKKWSIKCK